MSNQSQEHFEVEQKFVPSLLSDLREKLKCSTDREFFQYLYGILSNRDDPDVVAKFPDYKTLLSGHDRYKNVESLLGDGVVRSEKGFRERYYLSLLFLQSALEGIEIRAEDNEVMIKIAVPGKKGAPLGRFETKLSLSKSKPGTIEDLEEKAKKLPEKLRLIFNAVREHHNKLYAIARTESERAKFKYARVVQQKDGTSFVVVYEMAFDQGIATAMNYKNSDKRHTYNIDQFELEVKNIYTTDGTALDVLDDPSTVSMTFEQLQEAIINPCIDHEMKEIHALLNAKIKKQLNLENEGDVLSFQMIDYSKQQEALDKMIKRKVDMTKEKWLELMDQAREEYLENDMYKAMADGASSHQVLRL